MILFTNLCGVTISKETNLLLLKIRRRLRSIFSDASSPFSFLQTFTTSHTHNFMMKQVTFKPIRVKKEILQKNIGTILNGVIPIQIKIRLPSSLAPYHLSYLVNIS